MGNYTKTNPVGIDYKVQQLQTPMYNYLRGKYGLTGAQYDCYGRVYKNINKNGGYLPQAFTGESDRDYVADTFLNDSKVITSFFDISEDISVNQNLLCSAKVYLYFFLKLDALYPDEPGRNDEEFINTVVNFINTKYHFIVTSRTIGIKSILKDYTGYKGGMMDAQNYQPNLCFRLEIAMDNYLLRRYSDYRQPATLYSPIWVKRIPTGIDYKIQQLQVAMFNYLMSIWNITAEQYNCYGRIYLNKSGDRTYIPQAFKGVVEYSSDTFIDDSVAVTSFFDVGETVKVNKANGLDTAKINLYFAVNLDKIYADNTYRNDEECRLDVAGYINTKYGFLVKGITVGIKKVMGEYSGEIKKALLNKDMQPIHIFRIELLLPMYSTAQASCDLINAGYEFAPTEFNDQEFA